MALNGWFPPSTRARYETMLLLWQLIFPIMGSMQWFIEWYGMGKTSRPSRLNLPGRGAWMTMEAPGFLMLVYTVHSLSGGVAGLPWRNQVLTGLFVIHYIYRAILFPLLQPSMAPIHLAVWTMALTFQLLNASCLGAWLAVHGPTTAQEWTRQSPLPQFILGLSLFYAGLAANFFHDEEGWVL
ncbi:3-oxo-5-alpha-steroid 4-dehydrogenase [Ophiocordyceps camponoti-floridani]|uniref:3-oxo-5-alpha-steroid 4-dehydrogenase n=1 Tax=Ophiocordyceps camponoti-floridani TaxID=2030778 RepID=A0A8H4Q8U3_9HYPO|nr:3-oxo-5-alpha-steroid 4-dehydrogenase [Ophiocordyceps camponoti-floridani]